MREITDIYEEYKIMPHLQMHQLRVAAVAKVICKSLDINFDINSIITACLLHDMGNTIKFDLLYAQREFPEFFTQYDYEYQKNVQDEYIKKYGKDENHATIEIVKELNLSEETNRLIKEVVHHTKEYSMGEFDFAAHICKYSDMRAGPKGILLLKERLDEWRTRDPERAKDVLIVYKNFSEIESEIFSHSNIKPEDINDESVKEIIEELKNFEI